MRRTLLLLALAVLLAGCGTSRQPPAANPANGVVATVNGSPIDLGEFRLTLANDESAAYQYFQQAYGTKDGPAFWTTPVHGQRPIDWLKRQALTDAVRDKVAELLGQQRHVAAVLDYPALVSNLNAENQQRKVAVSQNQPVYGPQQLDLAEYYDVWLSNLKMRIIDTMPGGTAQQTDQSYATLLASTVKSATVRVNHQVYDAIDPADLGS